MKPNKEMLNALLIPKTIEYIIAFTYEVANVIKIKDDAVTNKAIEIIRCVLNLSNIFPTIGIKTIIANIVGINKAVPTVFDNPK